MAQRLPDTAVAVAEADPVTGELEPKLEISVKIETTVTPPHPAAPPQPAASPQPAAPPAAGTVYRPDDPDQDFTLAHYREILAAVTREHEPLSFRDAQRLGRDILKLDRFVIMRHDVEFSLTDALKMARLDHEAGIRSTFFLLFSSDYNIFEPDGAAIVQQILDLGHDIGLHYDLQAYAKTGADASVIARQQIELMEGYWNTTVYAMSCHMPMRTGRTLHLSGVVDVYDPLYLEDMKYVSDSTQKWRQGVVTKLLAKHDRIHLLMHEYYWSEEGHPFDVLLQREARKKFDELSERAEANILTYKQGLRLRAQRDAEFRRHLLGHD